MSFLASRVQLLGHTLRVCRGAVRVGDPLLLRCHRSIYLTTTPRLSSTKSTKSAEKTVKAKVTTESALPELNLPTFEPTFSTLSLDTFSELYTTKPANRSKIEHILNLYEHEKYTGTSEVPTTLGVPDMIDLLTVFPDEKELKQTLRFFYKRQCARFNSKIKREARKVTILETKKEKFKLNDIKALTEWEAGVFDSRGELVYGLWHNSLLSRITKQASRDYLHNHLLRQTALFGQKLIVDLDYDEYMKLYETRLLAAQIGILYYENRINRDYPEALPFDVHFTNCAKGTTTLAAIGKHIKRMDKLGGYFHQGSYLDYPELFPEEHLVYLSPHATQAITKYCHDDIYIIGGYNDKSTHMKVSHVKAQQEGIRCYRLPLDENVLWRQGSRNLCLNQVSAILQAVKATGDWKAAIEKWAPQRKIKSADELAIEDEIRAKKTARRMQAIQRSFNIEVDGKIYKL